MFSSNEYNYSCVFSAVKGHVDMSKAPSPGRQRLPVKEEGDRLVLYPKKAKSGPRAAVDMSKQIGHFHDEGKHDVDEGNVLKLSPRRVKLCVLYADSMRSV